MGILDFLKMKREPETIPEIEIPKSELFHSLSKYHAYVPQFFAMHQNGNFAPISAYEKKDGEVIGFLYAIDDKSGYNSPVEEVIHQMLERLETMLANEEINSYILLYYSQFNNDDNHKIATQSKELKGITLQYKFATGPAGKIGSSPVAFIEQGLAFYGFSNFSREENEIIITTILESDKVYFQDKIEIKAPSFENEIGLTITKSNSRDLINTWCGIFGFETYKKPDGGNILIRYTALARFKDEIFRNDKIIVSLLSSKDVSVKVVCRDKDILTLLPAITTDRIVDIENNSIEEWENRDNMEAIISGVGKDTFALSYLAIDYAENSDRYLTQRKLNIKISGIAFVLDIHNEEYTAYLYSSYLPGYACFDFLGILEEFRETNVFDDDRFPGYILKTRLITHPETEDFFTIDIFVAKENMRFARLIKGMRISGMAQFMGKIAD
jgi:hypothetical protein